MYGYLVSLWHMIKRLKDQGLSNNIYLISWLLNTLIKCVVLYWFKRFLLGNKIFIVVGLGYKFLQVILLIEFDSIIFLWQDLCWGCIASWITDQHQNRSNCAQGMTQVSKTSSVYDMTSITCAASHWRQ